MNARLLLYAAVAMGSTSIARAQLAAFPPLRQLGPRLAVTHDTLGNVWGIRALSDGRVFVNDILKHELLLFGSTLSHLIIIVDTTSTTKKAYGGSQGGIIAYRADTTRVSLESMPKPIRLALEMAAHEDTERRALEGELAMLEAQWKDAEDIAAISDNMFLPPGVEAWIKGQKPKG
jgi:hypothetical protein